MTEKFCAILSLVLVLAKIFGLITFSWWLCLAPYLLIVLFEIVFGIILGGLLDSYWKSIKKLLKDEDA